MLQVLFGGLTASYEVLVLVLLYRAAGLPYRAAGTTYRAAGTLCWLPDGPVCKMLLMLLPAGAQGALTGPQENQKQAVGAPISQIDLLSFPESFKNTNTRCTHKMEQTKGKSKQETKENYFVQLIFLCFVGFPICF